MLSATLLALYVASRLRSILEYDGRDLALRRVLDQATSVGPGRQRLMSRMSSAQYVAKAIIEAGPELLVRACKMQSSNYDVVLRERRERQR